MGVAGFCLFGSLRRINPCGSLASDGIKLNMMKMEKVYPEDIVTIEVT